MSQKYIKTQNKNSFNAKSYGKYYAQPVYDQKFIDQNLLDSVKMLSTRESS